MAAKTTLGSRSLAGIHPGGQVSWHPRTPLLYEPALARGGGRLVGGSARRRSATTRPARCSWRDGADYYRRARELAGTFRENFARSRT